MRTQLKMLFIESLLKISPKLLKFEWTNVLLEDVSDFCKHPLSNLWVHDQITSRTNCDTSQNKTIATTLTRNNIGNAKDTTEKNLILFENDEKLTSDPLPMTLTWKCQWLGRSGMLLCFQWFCFKKPLQNHLWEPMVNWKAKINAHK